ncbi:MAG: aldolase/citrate lyase family protein [Longimicrobiales bacterium]
MIYRRLSGLTSLLLLAAFAPPAAHAQSLAGWGTGRVSLEPVDAGRPWGWAVRDFMEVEDRQLYNTAKAKLLSGRQIFSHTISAFDIERYCAEAPHYDFTWFEMQHSTMRFDEVEAMVAACPRVGATPILRIPDALEGNVQKAMDIGMLGIIVPTVDDALEAREAARYARFPPTARRSSGGGQATGLWTPAVPSGSNFRESINDNMLIIVMIETPDGVDNALEIASTPGVDVVLLGNADLASFSGFAQDSPEYHDLQARTRNATYRAGKFWANAAFGNATGNPLSADSRVHQNGPSNDGWTRPGGGRGG